VRVGHWRRPQAAREGDREAGRSSPRPTASGETALLYETVTHCAPLYHVSDSQSGNPALNAQYCTSLPTDLAERLEEAAEAEGWTWRDAYKLALWLGLVAVEDNGDLRKLETALGGELTEGAVSHNCEHQVKIPRETRELVEMARRENMPWQRAQRIALTAGLATIEARGGLEETKRQVEAFRRLIRTQAFGSRPPSTVIGGPSLA
jgi:hypothetical protein